MADRPEMTRAEIEGLIVDLQLIGGKACCQAATAMRAMLAEREAMREGLRRIATFKLGGPWKPGQISGERRHMIELARNLAQGDGE